MCTHVRTMSELKLNWNLIKSELKVQYKWIEN